MDELEPVRRRRPGRAALGVLGVVVLVGAIVGVTALVGRDGEPKAGVPIADSPNEGCGHGGGLIDVFTTAPPPIAADALAKQEAMIDRIKARDWPGFRIVGAEPTHLGVVAFVDTGYDGAKKVLEAEGVRMVALEAEDLGDLHSQVINALQDLLQPAVDDIDRAGKHVPGFASLALWQEAGAVVLDWKAPVPAEIQALAGVRDDGVTVIVQPARYSEKETGAAQQRLSDAFDHHRVDARWSTSGPCQDGSGLVVGIQPDSLGSRKSELESQLSEIAGMPVHVVAEDAPSPAVLEVPRY